MSANFVWSIAQLERNVADGGVITAHWRCDGVEGDGEAAVSMGAYGSVGFQPDPASEGFKPFDQLTPEDVIAWVQASEEGFKDKVESAIQDQITAKMNPTTIPGVPWG